MWIRGWDRDVFYNLCFENSCINVYWSCDGDGRVCYVIYYIELFC